MTASGRRLGRWGLASSVVVGTVVAGCAGPAGEQPGPPPRFGLNVPGHEVAEGDRVGDLVGCPPALVSAFVKLDSDFGAAELAELGAGGRVPLITFEPWSWRSEHGDADVPAYALRRLVEGAWDDELLRLGDVLATHRGEVMLRFAHEMNADWYPWAAAANGNTPAQYVAAWRHVHRMVSQRAPHVTWVWAPVATWWPDALPLERLWPGEEYVDVVGVTGYGREDLDATTAEETFADWYDEVRALTTKPALLAEVGASGPGKHAWIRSLEPFLDDHPDIAGLVWFNTSPETTGATGDYRIDDDPGDTEVFRDLMKDLDPACLTPTPDRSPS